MTEEKPQQQLANESAVDLASELGSKRLKVVFAESCTAGLVSATLAQVPGISDYLCGSAVTYRPLTKQEWLGIDRSLIDEHSAESKPVTEFMAVQVLSKTPEAVFSAAVTGHLGPGAPEDKDGVVFMAVAKRINHKIELVASSQYTLASEDRVSRQHEATVLVFKQLLESIV